MKPRDFTYRTGPKGDRCHNMDKRICVDKTCFVRLGCIHTYISKLGISNVRQEVVENIPMTC